MILDLNFSLQPDTSLIGKYITALSHHMRTRREYREVKTNDQICITKILQPIKLIRFSS